MQLIWIWRLFIGLKTLLLNMLLWLTFSQHKLWKRFKHVRSTLILDTQSVFFNVHVKSCFHDALNEHMFRGHYYTLPFLGVGVHVYTNIVLNPFWRRFNEVKQFIFLFITNQCVLRCTSSFRLGAVQIKHCWTSFLLIQFLIIYRAYLKSVVRTINNSPHEK